MERSDYDILSKLATTSELTKVRGEEIEREEWFGLLFDIMTFSVKCRYPKPQEERKVEKYFAVGKAEKKEDKMLDKSFISYHRL